MEDCILKEIKEKFGKKLSLKGNLRTTDVMLRGSVKDVSEKIVFSERIKEAVDLNTCKKLEITKGDKCWITLSIPGNSGKVVECVKKSFNTPCACILTANCKGRVTLPSQMVTYLAAFLVPYHI